MFRHSWSAPMVAACAAALLLAGCATAGEPSAHSATRSASEKPTIEQIFQWPLEGRAGLERTVQALGELFPDAHRLTSAAALDSDTAAVLQGGAIISSATFRRDPPDINLNFSEAPCIDAKRMADLIGARLNASRVIKEMPDLGDLYQVERNGVYLLLRTEPITHKCVLTMFAQVSSKD